MTAGSRRAPGAEAAHGDPLAPEPTRVRKGFDAAAGGYDTYAFLQPRLRAALLERLEWVRLEPAAVVDLGCGTGAGALALARRYRRARVLALDSAPAMAAAARAARPWRLRRRVTASCADATALPLADASVDLIFSNLMLPWLSDPYAAFREARRVLRPGGLLTFSTLGPDTLHELRAAWAAVDAYPHINRFLDMHDVGDALLRAGLGEPVMAAEHLTVTYARVDGLLTDLRATGPGNTLRGRRRGLASSAGLRQLRAAYEHHRRDGSLPATIEVVYGHAWGTGPPRAVPAEGGEARFPLSALKRRRGG